MKYIVSFKDESEIPYLVKCDFQPLEEFICDAERAIIQKHFDYADTRNYVILYRCLRATLLLEKYVVHNYKEAYVHFCRLYIKTGIFPKEYGKTIRRVYLSMNRSINQLDKPELPAVTKLNFREVCKCFYILRDYCYKRLNMYEGLEGDAAMSSEHMGKRLTWEEIKRYFPHQVVGLVDCMPEGEFDIETAVVKYTDKTTPYETLVDKVFLGEIRVVSTDYEDDNLFRFQVNRQTIEGLIWDEENRN